MVHPTFLNWNSNVSCECLCGFPHKNLCSYVSQLHILNSKWQKPVHFVGYNSSWSLFSQFNTRIPMLQKDFFVFDKCFMPLSTRMISVLGSNEGNKEAWSLGYSFVLKFAYWQIVWPQSWDVLPEEVLNPEGTILEAEKKIGLENQPMVNEESYNCRFSCCFKSTFRTN